MDNEAHEVKGNDNISVNNDRFHDYSSKPSHSFGVLKQAEIITLIIN